MTAPKPYDVLIVGSGLYGAVFARQLTDAGYKCLVIDKRSHIAGNVYSERKEGVDVHKYGPHIFHTNSKDIWDYVNRFAEFNSYEHHMRVKYQGEHYSFPVNLETFEQVFGFTSKEEVQSYLAEQQEVYKPVDNLESWAISQIGPKLYNMFVKGYTEKQWGRKATELPKAIIKRIPIRMERDDRYFNDQFQGIPIEGYTKMVEQMLDGIEVRLNIDFFDMKDEWRKTANYLIYTGPIDAYFDYKLGALEYRSLRFEEEVVNQEFFQPRSIVNYTEAEIPYTRIVEHKHFVPERSSQKTVITREYPQEWKKGMEPFYPVNNAANNSRFSEYKKLSANESNVLFGGRLGEYKYYDMHQVIGAALAKSKSFISSELA